MSGDMNEALVRGLRRPQRPSNLQRPKRPAGIARPQRPEGIARPIYGQTPAPSPSPGLAPGTRLLRGGLTATPEQFQGMPGWLQQYALRHGPAGQMYRHFAGPVRPPGATTRQDYQRMLESDRFSGGMPAVNPQGGSGPVGPWMDQQLDNALAGRPIEEYVDPLTAALRSNRGPRDDFSTQGG